MTTKTKKRSSKKKVSAAASRKTEAELNRRAAMNGWKILYITGVVKKSKTSDDALSVTVASSDARMNGATLKAVESLIFAERGYLYAIKFSRGEVIHAMELERPQPAGSAETVADAESTLSALETVLES